MRHSRFRFGRLVRDFGLLAVPVGLAALLLAFVARAQLPFSVAGWTPVSSTLGKQAIYGGVGSNTAIAAGTTNAGDLRATYSFGANTSAPYVKVPVKGTFSNFHLYANVSGGITAGSATMNFYKAGTLQTSVGCSITTGNECDGTASFSANAGDKVALTIVTAASTPTTGVLYSILFTPDSGSANTFIMNVGGHLTGAGPAEYWVPIDDNQGLTITTPNSINNSVLVGVSGTITAVYADLLSYPSGSVTETFAPTYGALGSPTDMSMTSACTITSASAPCSGTLSGSIVASSGTTNNVLYASDTIANGSVTQNAYGIGLAYQPTTTGQFDIKTNMTNAGVASTSVTNYFPIAATNQSAYSASATEATWQVPAQAMTVTALHVHVNTAPGAGKSWTIRLRDGGGNVTGSDCVISGASGAGSQDCDASFTATISDKDMIDYSITPSGTPTSLNNILAVMTAHT